MRIFTAQYIYIDNYSVFNSASYLVVTSLRTYHIIAGTFLNIQYSFKKFKLRLLASTLHRRASNTGVLPDNFAQAHCHGKDSSKHYSQSEPSILQYLRVFKDLFWCFTQLN